jgi:hypothetical protein
MKPLSNRILDPTLRWWVTSSRAGADLHARSRRRRTCPGCESLEGRLFLNGAWTGPSPIAVNPQPLPPYPVPVSVAGVNWGVGRSLRTGLVNA